MPKPLYARFTLRTDNPAWTPRDPELSPEEVDVELEVRLERYLDDRGGHYLVAENWQALSWTDPRLSLLLLAKALEEDVARIEARAIELVGEDA